MEDYLQYFEPRFRDLVTSYKVPVVNVDTTRHRYTWDGHTLALEDYADPLDLCHELAHYIVAEPWQRHIPDFGLGRGPRSFVFASSSLQYQADKYYQLDNTSLIDEQEEMASMLTLLIGEHLRVPIEDIMLQARRDGWAWHRNDPYSPPRDPMAHTRYDARQINLFFETIKALHRRELVDDKTQLTYRINHFDSDPMGGLSRCPST